MDIPTLRDVYEAKKTIAPHLLSMAEACWATGVSLLRINVRLSGRQKCHSVMLPWYQMKTS